jgi:hypothetical protein
MIVTEIMVEILLIISWENYWKSFLSKGILKLENSQGV